MKLGEEADFGQRDTSYQMMRSKLGWVRETRSSSHFCERSQRIAMKAPDPLCLLRHDQALRLIARAADAKSKLHFTAILLVTFQVWTDRCDRRRAAVGRAVSVDVKRASGEGDFHVEFFQFPHQREEQVLLHRE